MELKGARILVVEDETAIASRLCEAVTTVGATIVGPAHTVGEACALASSQAIDAAVLDLIVDGIYCDDVAKELLQRQIPFAVTTGIGASAEHPELRAAKTIMKPFQTEHVQDVLSQLLCEIGD